MIIPPRHLPPAATGLADSVRDRTPAAAPERQDKAETATVSVSLSAASLDAARAPASAATATGDIDTAKVERIIQAIRQGEYQMDAGRIADGLLSSAKDLLKP